MTRILVVEDESPSRAVISKALTRLGGYEVIFTEEVEAALRLTRSGEVALVLMDVSLANSRYQDRAVNGVDLCRILKSDPETCDVPIVLATAHAMRGDEEMLLAESGADDYLSKPVVDHTAFVARIRRSLHSEAA